MTRALIPILLLTVASAFAQNFDDEFNSMIMKTGWSWTREDRAHWQLTGTALVITTQPGALNGMDFNDVRNILLQPAPAVTFRFETKLTFSPDSIDHNAGLIYYINDDNYIRVSRGKYRPSNGPDINGVWMEWEVNGMPDIVAIDNITLNPVHLRLSRTDGTKFFASYSSDTINWQPIHGAIINFIGGPAKIGLQAANGQGSMVTAARIPAQFDYFHTINTPINEIPTAGAEQPSIQRLYPQPLTQGANAILQYSLPAGADVMVRMTDLLGRAIWSSTFHESSGEHSLRIPTSDARPGTYWLQLSTGRGFAMRQFMIVR